MLIGFSEIRYVKSISISNITWWNEDTSDPLLFARFQIFHKVAVCNVNFETYSIIRMKIAGLVVY